MRPLLSTSNGDLAREVLGPLVFRAASDSVLTGAEVLGPSMLRVASNLVQPVE
jgi:hypothetical protein